MDETSLVSVLAEKYGIDVSEDYMVMNLFNKLCTVVDIDQRYKAQIDETIRVQSMLDAYNFAITGLLKGEGLSKISKNKIKAALDDLGFEIDFSQDYILRQSRVAIPDNNTDNG